MHSELNFIINNSKHPEDPISIKNCTMALQCENFAIRSNLLFYKYNFTRVAENSENCVEGIRITIAEVDDK